MANFFTELWDRIQSDTPIFFKKIQAIGAALVAMKASVIAIPGISPELQSIATQAAIIGGVMAVVGQFACKDKTPPPPPVQ
jgi:hypothetical protein